MLKEAAEAAHRRARPQHIIRGFCSMHMGEGLMWWVEAFQRRVAWRRRQVALMERCRSRRIAEAIMTWRRFSRQCVEERRVRKELERYLTEMAEDKCVYRMDLTVLCGGFIEEHHVAVSTLIGGRLDVFLSRAADTFVLDRNGRVALKEYADLCDVSDESSAPAEPSTRTHPQTQTTASATLTAPSLPSPHMTTTSGADAAPPSSHPMPSSHSRSTDGSSCFDSEVDEALMRQSAGQPGGAEETVRTMAADGEKCDGDGQAPALPEATSSSSTTVLPQPHTQKPSSSQADDVTVPTPTHTQGAPDQPAPFPSLDQQPDPPHTHTSTTPTSTHQHQHQHQQYPHDVTVTWWRPVQQPQQQPVAVPVAGASCVRRVGEAKVAEGVYSELHLKISSQSFNLRVAQNVKALVEGFESDSWLNLESISKSGAANNGTAVGWEIVEYDPIANTEGLPTKSFDTWYPPLCRVLGGMVTMLLPPEHVTELYILPNAVTFTYKGMLSVSVNAAPVFETHGELMQCLGESPSRVREYLHTAFTPYRYLVSSLEICVSQVHELDQWEVVSATAGGKSCRIATATTAKRCLTDFESTTLPGTAKLTDGTHMEMDDTATDRTVAHMLRDLLQHHQRATWRVGDGPQMDGLSLLFCYRYGSTIEDALRLVGSEYGGFGEFIRSRDELRLVNNTVWLASESESDVNGGGGEDGGVSCQLTPEEERIVRKDLQRYLTEMAKDHCVYRMDHTALCGGFIEEHKIAVSTLIGGRLDVFLSRAADTFVLDRNGRVALKKYADPCGVSEEALAPAEPSTRSHTPTQTTASATLTAPSLPSPHMTTTSGADAAPPSSHPMPSSHSRTMAADGEKCDGDGQAPALPEATSSSSTTVLPQPHTQKPSSSQADDVTVPTPTHTQGAPDQPAPFLSLDQQPHRPHTHTSTTPTPGPQHQHHQQLQTDALTAIIFLYELLDSTGTELLDCLVREAVHTPPCPACPPEPSTCGCTPSPSSRQLNPNAAPFYRGSFIQPPLSPPPPSPASLKLRLAAYSRAKRRQGGEGNEDALFMAPRHGAFGVADGVSGVMKSFKFSARDLAQDLMARCWWLSGIDHRISTRQADNRAMATLTKAWYGAERRGPLGSTTATVAALMQRGHELRIELATFGDSVAFVIRSTERSTVVIAELTPMQRPNRTNCPYQLSRLPASVGADETNIIVDPTPEDLVARPPCAPGFFIDKATEERSPLGVQCCTAAVQEGDIVIAATDGVFDNITMDDVLDIIKEHDRNDANAIAQTIGSAAYSRSLGGRGKKDDVTVVVGVVCGGAVTEADEEACIA
ncbi:unnamed protein product [Vitrella brassicaformis CCMP3155]|uniref:PPM-type phosphatase domain-containing protein n=1 Tax=Vitrella brassicaformis (strain CCMP3155) TaxID=1169540 RepID=A0A0G4EQJ8_VITBC|nr:unnamed protein product [Vitrella brassicaformis CCMP3155]|eukprot:CEM00362.1 unnamed protein product [Vitrella brassicaformis CCMP3155]